MDLQSPHFCHGPERDLEAGGRESRPPQACKKFTDQYQKVRILYHQLPPAKVEGNV